MDTVSRHFLGAAQVRFHRGRRDTWAKARHDVEKMGVAKPRLFLSRHHKDRPDVHRLSVPVRAVAAAHVLHSLGQHANDTVGFSGKTNGTSDDGGITVESTHPQPVTQDDDVAVAGNLVGDLEVSSHRRLITKNGEESGGHLHTPELLGMTRVADLQVAAKECRDTRERLQLVAIIAEVCWRHRKMRRPI